MRWDATDTISMRFGYEKHWIDVGSANSAPDPDQFKLGRHVVVSGRYTHGVFVAKRDSLVTKCPSKYAPKKT